MKLEEALKSTRFHDEAHKAGLNILYTAYWLKSHISTALKETGITSEQFNVLRILKGKHPEQMCVKDIASRMLEKNSNVPRIADRLVIKKLVKRANSKEDKRETIMSLTEKGLQVLEAANKTVEEVNTRVMGLNNDEAKKLNELIEKMRKTD
jgi:DNA-binding MarR family transcriptional regulator